jgi:hypothetical protein
VRPSLSLSARAFVLPVLVRVRTCFRGRFGTHTRCLGAARAYVQAFSFVRELAVHVAAAIGGKQPASALASWSFLNSLRCACVCFGGVAMLCFVTLCYVTRLCRPAHPPVPQPVTRRLWATLVTQYGLTEPDIHKLCFPVVQLFLAVLENIPGAFLVP